VTTYHSPFGKGYRPKFPKGKARQRPNPSVVKKVPAGHDTAGRPKAHRHKFDHPVFVEAQLHHAKAVVNHVAGVNHHVLGVTRRVRKT
jgi:hypothetical protein